MNKFIDFTLERGPRYFIRVTVTTGFPLKYVKGGDKTYNRKTECIIYTNGFIDGEGSVTKHRLEDKDDLALATVKAVKKAAVCINTKYIRELIWDKIFEEIEENDGRTRRQLKTKEPFLKKDTE